MPGGRAGTLELGGYRFDTGPTVLTMPDLVERCFTRGRRRHGRPTSRCGRSTPCTGPASPTAASCGCATAARRWPRRSARCAGRPRPTAFERFCDWLDRALPRRDAALHRAQLRLARSTCCARCGPALELVRLGGVRPAGAAGGAASSTTTGCAGCSASSRCTPAWRPTRRSPSTRSSPTWTRSTACSCPTAACTPCRGRWPRPPTKAGVEFRYGAPVERILLGHGTTGPVRGVRLAGGEVVAGRRGRVQPPTCPSPTARCCPGLPRPGRLAPGALLAVRRRVARRRPGRAARRAPPTTTSTSAGQWDGPSGRCSTTGAACPTRRSWSRCRPSTSRSMAPAGRHVLYVLEPVPEPRRRASTGRPSGSGPATTCRRGRPARLPDRRRGRGARRPPRLGGPGAWSGARRSPCRTGSSRPVRSGPATSTGGRPGLVFAGSGDRARRRRADGAGVGPAGRRAGRERAVTAAHDDRRSRSTSPTPAAGSSTGATARPTTGRPTCCPRRSATTCGRSTGSAATPTTSSTTSATCRSTARRDGADRLRRPVLRRPRRRAAPTTRCSRRSSTPSGASAIDPSCFRRFLRSMAMDLTSSTLRDLGRPARLHGRLGGRDRRDDAADPRAADRRRPSATPATSASPSSSPTSCATSARTSTAAGCTSRRRTSAASAPTRGAGGRRAWRAADAASRSTGAAASTGRPTTASRCCPRPRPAASRAARVLYAGILDRIEAADYDVFTQPGPGADLAQGRDRAPGSPSIGGR